MELIRRNTTLSIAREIIEKRGGPEFLKDYLSRVLGLYGNDFVLAYKEVSELIKLEIRHDLEFAKIWRGEL